MCLLRFFTFLLLLGLCFTEVQAQNAVVRGFAKDVDDGQPLQGVNVVLTNDGGAFLGTATDRDGFYAISRIPPGVYTLRASYVGYETFTDTVALAADEIRLYNFNIGFGGEAMDEVVVESERTTAGAAGVSGGLQSIRPQDIQLIPSPDLSGDLASYLVTLPGVVSGGDQGGQLFIRGGEPTQNLVLMDGMTVYQPFHLIGFYSAFPSSILNVSDVYAGGFGARYGGRLSSVIDISTRNGNKRSLAGELSLAPFISAAILEGPIIPGRVSMLVSGRFSVIEQGASRLIDTPLPYDFNDQFVKIHADLSENNQASVSAIRSYDKGIIGAASDAEADSVRDQVIWENRAIGGRYLLLPTRIPVQAELLLSSSSIENKFGLANAPSRSGRLQEFNAAANVTHFMGTTDLTWGIYLRLHEIESRLDGVFQDVSDDKEFVSEAGGYVETELEVMSGLRIEPSLRFHSFPSKGRNFLEPRMRAVWDYDVHRFSAAAGLYHQEIVGLTDRRDAGDVFTAWTSSPLGQVPEAIHVIAGYQVRPSSWLRVALEGFYKQMSNLSIAEWSAFPRFTTRLQPADGQVLGFDGRVEIIKDPFYGFLNYGYSEVTYDARQSEVEHWFGTSNFSFSPPHDRRHQFNALGSLRIRGFALSVRWQFGSGLPFSEALGFDEFFVIDGPTDVGAERGDTRVLYGLPYGGRLPTYHRLDVSLEKGITLTNSTVFTLQASATNAYDRVNLFYIDLFSLERLDQLPLVPSFGVKLEF